MSKIDFDQQIDRSGTYSLKYDARQRLFGREDAIPLWVADMDFQTAQPIIDGLIERVRHGIFGYTFASEDYFKSITNWY